MIVPTDQPQTARRRRSPVVAEGFADEAGLAEAERRQGGRTAALLRAAMALNEAGSLDALMPALGAAAAEAVGADRASVYAYDETRTRTIAAAHYDPRHGGRVLDLAADLRAWDALPPQAVPAEAEVLRTGRPLPRGVDTPFPNPHQPDDWRSDIVVPLLAAGAVQGALLVREAGRARVFSSDEVALLQAIGNQAGLAILRARDAAAAERRAEHLTLLNQVGRALSGSLEVEELCAIIHAEVSRVVAADAFYVALCVAGDAEAEEVWFPYMVDEGRRVPAERVRLAQGPTRHVVRTRRPYVMTSGGDALAHAGNTFGNRGKCSESALYVPLLRGDHLIGVLSVQRYDPAAYDEDDLRTLETIAQQAAAAFAHARLYAETLADKVAAERHAADLGAVLAIARSIASAADLTTMLDALARELAALVPHDGIALYRLTPDGARLAPLLVRKDGVDLAPSSWSVRRDEGLVGSAFVRGRAERVNDAHLDPRAVYPDDWPWSRGASEDVLLAPLAVAGHVIGVLFLNRVGGHPFTRREFSVFRVLAEQAAVAVRNAGLLARNRELYLGGIGALASAVDAKDPSTRGHSERVGRLAGRVAAALGLDRAEVEAVELAGLLHDIGKIGVPDAILQKPGALDDAERATMIGHVALGAEILASAGADALRPLVPLVRHHHERVDGGGYPDGLAGDAIPRGAAIIAVADAFDTMVTDRPYRPRRPAAEAVAELRRQAGTQFAAEVVESVAELVTSDAPLVNDPPLPASDPDGDDERAPRPREVPAAGQMGDTRALGLLVELAAVTRHIPDLQQFLGRVAAIVQRGLGYQDVTLLLVDGDRGELVLAAHSGRDGGERPDDRPPLDAGVLGEVVRTGCPRSLPVVRGGAGVAADGAAPGGSGLAVPLVVEDRTIGVINVASDRLAAFTAGDEAVLTAVAGQLASAVHVAQLHDAVKRAAATDGLTGLANHRAFYDALADAVAGEPSLSVVLMDVEGLKQVNDTAGHLAGDALLRRVARVVRANVRVEDVVARYGGDEFAIIMRGVDGAAAARVAARVRRELREVEPTGAIAATVRYGVATRPEDGTRPTDLVAAADRRLYEMRGRR